MPELPYKVADPHIDRREAHRRQPSLRSIFVSSLEKLLPGCHALTRALHSACQEGDVKETTRLLSAGAYVDGMDGHGLTALVYAIRRQDPAMVNLLLEYGANTNKACATCYPLMEAVEAKSLELVELLVRHGANANTPTYRDERFFGITALHRAAELDLADMVYFLLSYGGADCSAGLQRPRILCTWDHASSRRPGPLCPLHHQS